MLILYIVLTSVMVAVIANDVSRYRIPNALVLALILLYPLSVYLAHPRPAYGIACLIALAVFAVGYALFFLRLMGGGDIKLLTACALYAGREGILDFIVDMAILGGLGTLLLLGLRAMTPFVALKLGRDASSIPRVLTEKEPVPYGVAIAGAFLILLWTGKLPGLVL